MPYSSNSGKAYTTSVINNLPASIKAMQVLDIGAGSGTYSDMFKHILQGAWTGVEVYEPYIAQFELSLRYDTLLLADARIAVDSLEGTPFGVAFLGDVLEHMAEAEAQDLLTKVRQLAEVVVVSIPIGYYPQDAYEGNPYEVHVTDNWSDESYRTSFGIPDFAQIENEIGIYIYSRLPMPKIAVYAISKDEEQFVDRFCDSVSEADYVVIADTGSTDKTVELAKANGAMTYNVSIQPWRFDHARNASLALVPADAEICISLDLDEVMEPGWREAVLSAWAAGPTRLSYKFDWGHGIVFYSDKIHKRNGYLWKHPCHELLHPQHGFVERWGTVHKQLITHYPDATKSRGSYLALLRIGAKEDPTCPRNSFYFARELAYKGLLDEALVELQRYLALPTAVWIVERAYAMRVLGDTLARMGRIDEGLKWLRLACAEDPTHRESWFYLGRKYYDLGQWEHCYASLKQVLSITVRDFVYTTESVCWGSQAYDYAAIAAHNLGLSSEAVELGAKALELDPQDIRLVKNLESYNEVLRSKATNT